MFFVITADMKQSRNAGELHLLERVSEMNEALRPVVPAELYAGDEIQLLLNDSGGQYLMQVLFQLIRILQPNNFRYGIGLGQIQLPVKEKLAENNGEAFINAREALEFTKKNDRLAWIKHDFRPEYDNLNIALAFLSELTKNWSNKHWRRLFLYAKLNNIVKVAEIENVSPEAINKFLNTAGIKTILSVVQPNVLNSSKFNHNS